MLKLRRVLSVVRRALTVFRAWSSWGRILAWEWQDPELPAVHFLTVASYNLQHPAQFTGPALVGLREQFVAHLDEGVPVTEIRRRVGRLASAGATAWSSHRQNADRC